jgi:NAD(P)-dependent dehydrogenase (short-subunit alcohol dehydrogenase family)
VQRPGNAGSQTGSSLLTGDLAATNALRLELAPQGTQVTALHVGYMKTDMVRNLDVPKSDPAAIAKLAIDGVEAGDAEVIADDTSKRIRAGLSAGVAGFYPQVA